MPIAFRRLELDARLSRIRAAQVAVEPGLAALTKMLVIIGDCPAAGRWIERCGAISTLVLRHPQATTVLAAIDGIRQRPPPSLALDVGAPLREARDALLQLFDHLAQAPEIARIKLIICANSISPSAWPSAWMAPHMQAVDVVSDDPLFVQSILGSVQSLHHLRMQNIPGRYTCEAWVFQGYHVRQPMLAALGSLRRLTLVDIGFRKWQWEIAFATCSSLEHLVMREHDVAVPFLYETPPPPSYPSSMVAVALDLSIGWSAIIENIDATIDRQRGEERMERMGRLRIERRGDWQGVGPAERDVLVEQAAAVGLRLQLVDD